MDQDQCGKVLPAPIRRRTPDLHPDMLQLDTHETAQAGIDHMGVFQGQEIPERDVMLLWLTHTTGIRVTELALLEVADVLYPSGAIKPEVYLRADITKGCRPRNVT